VFEEEEAARKEQRAKLNAGESRGVLLK